MIGAFIAEIPVISPIFQAILDGIGWVLAGIYDALGNYGVSIIVLTILVRLLLLPLGIRQIRSMHNMQRLQPKIKALQQKYKGNRQRQQEEIMKLYKESGVNPLSGCWPVLLQFPILIAMYAVLRPPTISAESNRPGETVILQNNHVPVDSALFESTLEHRGTDFLWMNLQCSALQAGTGDVALRDSDGKAVVSGALDKDGDQLDPSLDCGSGIPVRIPYYTFLLLMVGSTFYQQRQMQKASPPGATNPQQQALFKIMPILFGVFGIQFPAALVLYWTTSNLWQIGQQAVMLRLGHIGPNAKEPAPRPGKTATKPGLMSGLMSRAEQERKRRGIASGKAKGPGGGTPRKASPAGSDEGGSSKGGSSKGGSSKGGSSKGGSQTGSSSTNPSRKPKPGGSSGAGNRKKRPKR